MSEVLLAYGIVESIDAKTCKEFNKLIDDVRGSIYKGIAAKNARYAIHISGNHRTLDKNYILTAATMLDIWLIHTKQKPNEAEKEAMVVELAKRLDAHYKRLGI